MENLRQELQSKFDAIEARIKELEALKSQPFKTSCQFRYNPNNSYNTLDINRTLNVEELIHANAFVQYKAEQYYNSAKQLGVSEFPVFKWCGYAPELWMEDIKLRLSLIGMDKELTKLKELKAKIQPFLPEENKLKQLLLEIA